MDLAVVKKQLVKMKSKKDELIGERNTYMNQLKEQGIKSLSEAKDQLKDMSEKITSLDVKFAKNSKKFKTNYGHLLDD